MRSLVKYLLATFALCSVVAMFAPFAAAQEDTIGPAVPAIPSGAFAAIPDDATLSAEDFRAEVAKGIVQAARNDKTVSRGELRRLERVMRGGWLVDSRKEAIVTKVVMQLHAVGAIAVTPEGVQAAIDWDQVFLIIEKMIPIIKMFIALFGG